MMLQNDSLHIIHFFLACGQNLFFPLAPDNTLFPVPTGSTPLDTDKSTVVPPYH